MAYTKYLDRCKGNGLRAVQSQEPELTGPQPGVLIVDDNDENRRMLVRALNPLDIATYEAASGEAALDIATRVKGLFVAILDVRMPGMDGYALARALRSLPEAETLPIIFISAQEAQAYPHQRAYETGAVDFLMKPVSARTLLSKVRVFLELYRQRSQLQAVNTTLSKQTLRLETSAEVIHQIASILDLDQLLAEILSLIRDQFGYCYTGIWMMADDEETIVLRSGQYGTPGPIAEPGYGISRDAERSIIAQVCRTGVLYLSNDTRNDPRYLPAEELPDIRSELALPLRFGDAVLGVLDIQTEAVGAFSPEDISALQMLADQIAVAIRNARLYAEVRRLNEELEAQVHARTEELETAYQHLELLDHSKSDFITVVSHELRTPLTLINGFSQMLLNDPSIVEDPERHREVTGIVKGARRMHSIVDSMLDIVKIDSRTLQLEYTSVSLAHLLEELAHRLRETLRERQLTLTLEGLATLPPIDADPDELIKVFGELLTNAIKYTPDGGRIHVTGQLLSEDQQERDDYVEIMISDTGIGIPENAHELIFQKFYRTGEVTFYSSGKTKFKGGGPGLGLSLARGIVDAHDGQIWVESPGYDEATLPGSTFHVILPVSQPPSARAPLSADGNADSPAHHAA
jgi:signal transduction histidine kinase/CheY-like chemotaxis protein